MDNNEKILNYIDELGNEYKKILLERITEEVSDPNDISIGDLLRIDNDIKRYARNHKRNRIFRLYIVLSASYLVLGLSLYLISSNIGIILSNDFSSTIVLLSIILIISGLYVTMICVWRYYGRKKDPKLKHNPRKELDSTINTEANITINRSFLEYRIISIWRDIEAICNDISTEPIHGRKVVDFLSQTKLINHEDAEILYQLLIVAFVVII